MVAFDFQLPATFILQPDDVNCYPDALLVDDAEQSPSDNYEIFVAAADPISDVQPRLRAARSRPFAQLHCLQRLMLSEQPAAILIGRLCTRKQVDRTLRKQSRPPKLEVAKGLAKGGASDALRRR